MNKTKVDISVSLDGYVAGPNQSLDDPLGEGGEALHEWVIGLESWRQTHGKEGGETGAESELVEASTSATGASIMGRRMYSSGSGPWEDDPKARGWWGDAPPFGHPVFVLTHHPREPLEMEGGTTFNFVTDGIESALDQARAAAGERDVHVAGGANVAQQYLSAGLVDELTLHVSPVMLGAGERLFDGVPALSLEPTLKLPGTTATHLRFNVR